ncbi:MAG: non-canonical purine NTP pyrophosphatase, RdgB/HAM1 family [Spirochaetes bacterium RBG_13_51_14]|nr:MAG: non-canonical purine NTP pyrophosphatase, RdgB/HAM1 family [Spirochaetes bacterium RBG_13_51_14]
MKLVIATHNIGKIREIRNKFADIPGLELVPLSDFPDAPEVIENGKTFKENAHRKAREAARFTGLPAMADDSGLVVDALGGRPGVRSARYGQLSAADADRNRMILDELRDVPADRRTTRFVCVISIQFPDGGGYFAEGACEGIIAESMRGSHGFGYDPIFYLPDVKKTMAELTMEEKNRISHRAKALDAMRKILIKLGN